MPIFLDFILSDVGTSHGLIKYIDTKAKCRHLTKLTCKRTLRQVFICLGLRTPDPPLCTLYTCIQYTYSHRDGGGGGGGQREG
jgi:hypothetical protein